MTEQAVQLLKKMVAEFDKSECSSFDSMFYIGYQNSVIKELEDNGYITVKNDITGTIELTRSGYEAAAK